MKRVGRIVCLLLVISFIATAAPCTVVSALDDIVVVIDGVRVEFPDAQPVFVDGRTLVPVRGVFETLGFVVDWESSTFTATLTSDSSTVIIRVGDDVFITNGSRYELDVPAQIIDTRLMLPFRALIESVGYYAYWHSETGTVFIFTEDPAEDSDDTPDESEAVYPPERNWQSGILPPSGGRRVVPGQPFGVDLHYNSNVIFHSRFYVEATSVSRYINALGTLQERYPETVRVFNLLVPSHVEFLPERYSADVFKQQGPIENINNWLETRGVTPVEAYDILAERASKEYLYFRTDHHWTALGAYYAYIAFTRAAGLEPVNIYNYTEFAIPNFIGTYVTDTPTRAVINSPDTLYYYRLDNGTTFSRSMFSRASGGYRLFLGGDHSLLDFTSSNKNGRTLIVIKDSYANAFIPWVAPHYERIVVIDPRHYNGGIRRFLGSSEEADVDVLFLSSANTPSYPGYVSSMARIVGA